MGVASIIKPTITGVMIRITYFIAVLVMSANFCPSPSVLALESDGKMRFVMEKVNTPTRII